MGLDAGQSAIGGRDATLRTAVWTSATDGKGMDAIGMDACGGRNQLQEVLRKPEGKIPVGPGRYFSSVTQLFLTRGIAYEKITNPLKLLRSSYRRRLTPFSCRVRDARADAICIVRPHG